MDLYVKLAKEAVENYIKAGEAIGLPADLPEEMLQRKAGIFVTIHNGDELRGCIGTYLPTKKNLAEEIISNAAAACSRDFRFSPITKEELPDLNYEVSLLSKPELVKDIEKHDVKKEGILVQCADGRGGLLLPDLEGVDSTEEQITIACRKGGIDPQTDEVQLYSFTVEKHA